MINVANGRLKLRRNFEILVSREKPSVVGSRLQDSHRDPQEGKLSSKQQELGVVREQCLSDLMAAVKLREEKLTASKDKAYVCASSAAALSLLTVVFLFYRDL